MNPTYLPALLNQIMHSGPAKPDRDLAEVILSGAKYRVANHPAAIARLKAQVKASKCGFTRSVLKGEIEAYTDELKTARATVKRAR